MVQLDEHSTGSIQVIFVSNSNTSNTKNATFHQGHIQVYVHLILFPKWTRHFNFQHCNFAMLYTVGFKNTLQVQGNHRALQTGIMSTLGLSDEDVKLANTMVVKRLCKYVVTTRLDKHLDISSKYHNHVISVTVSLSELYMWCSSPEHEKYM